MTDLDALAPPNSLDAERAALGACLIDRRAFNTCRERLKPSHFYQRAHALIFEAMADVSAGAVDLVTVADRLRERDRLEAAGGVSYLATLADMVPTTANAGYYAGIVYDKALRRGMLAAARDIERWARDEAVATSEALNLSEGRVMGVAEHAGASVPAMPAALSELDGYLRQSGGVRIPTSLDTITNYMSGGYLPGYYTLLGADPGIGKTRHVIRECWHHLRAGRGVGFLSLEIPRPEIMANLMALELGINRDALGNGAPDDDAQFGDPFATTPDSDEYREAAKRMASWRYAVWEDSITADEIETVARRMVRDHGIELLYVDYAGCVESPGSRGVEAMEDAAMALAVTYKRLNLCGMVLCHVTTQGGDVKPYYSRRLDQACQAFWYVPKPEAEQPIAYEWRNIKNRYGRRSRHALTVGWDYENGYFQDLPSGFRGAGM